MAHEKHNGQHTTVATNRLYDIGTSVWLDDLSRDLLHGTENFELFLLERNILGITTNPAIFSAAISAGGDYDRQLDELREENVTAEEAVYRMSIRDVQEACDVLAGVYQDTHGRDGRVSIEVDPRYAHDEEKTITQARELWKQVARPNAMIKIPATDESLPAVTTALSEGISVNVTLIFSVDRYKQVIDAYKEGLKRAAAQGRDLEEIHSVASFFVSRMDVEVDKRLETIGTPEALALRGKAGIANARLAYHLFLDSFTDVDELPPRANKQRPLWASTGVKNPEYPQNMYVVELAGPDTVNTMPMNTINVVNELDQLKGDTLTYADEQAREVFDGLEQVGIDLADVVAVLEREGVEKFVTAWQDLLDSTEEKLNAAK
mgnify:CR=1 FL=1